MNTTGCQGKPARRAGRVIGWLVGLLLMVGAAPGVVHAASHGVVIQKTCQGPRRSCDTNAFCSDGLVCTGEELCDTSISNVVSCDITVAHFDTYGDTLQLLAAFDVEDFGGDNVRVPPGTADLQIVTVSGNTTCTVGGSLPCNIGKDVGSGAGEVTFRDNTYVVQPDDANPLLDQGNVRVKDLCDAVGTMNCSLTPNLVQFSASTELVTGCLPGTPPDCGASDQCTDRGCAEPGGCFATDTSARCNDGRSCTIDACDPVTGCSNTPNNGACDDANVCTDDACSPASPGADPVTGCIHPDNSARCNDNKSCTTDVCDPVNGCSNTPNNAACDDLNVCTDDACSPASAGADPVTGCTHTDNSARCNDNKSCTTDLCNPVTGCSNTPNNAACNDNNVCTDETCSPASPGADSATGCLITDNSARCNDGKSCTSDVCDPVSGCVNTPNNAACNDSNVCTDDSCSPASPGANPTTGCLNTDNSARCNDGKSCTQDACNPVTGCSNTPNNGLCNDDDPCTRDTCSPGSPGADSASGCLNILDSSLPGCGSCGNGVVDAGETCDPPNPALDPVTHQVLCRPDCTRCGDGVVQNGANGTPNDGETCDDANTVSGCDPARPKRALDGCLNNCAAPICSDPARIQFAAPMDIFTFHANLIWNGSIDFAHQDFVYELRDANDGLIYRAALPAGSLRRVNRRTYSFHNPDRALTAGISRLKIRIDPGTNRIYMTAYGDLHASVADMTAHVYVGQMEWAIRGLWEHFANGWGLTIKSVLLPVQ